MEHPFLTLDQSKFVDAVLARHQYNPSSRPVATPLSSSKKLVPYNKPKEDANPKRVMQYKQIIGSLMYLMLGTRPDLTYAVGKLACFSNNPSPDHTAAVDRVLSYVSTTKGFVLKYVKQNGGALMFPFGYTNADWAGDPSDWKSVAGYVFLLTGATFSWASKKQSTITNSTLEAEYITLHFGSQNTFWIRQFQEELGFPFEDPLIVLCDNQPTISVTKGEGNNSHKATKTIDYKLHSIQDRIRTRQMDLCYVASKDNCTDMFTKSLPTQSFGEHMESIGLFPTGPRANVAPPSPSIDPDLSSFSQYQDTSKS